MSVRFFFEFKGARNYVQGGDIFNSLADFALGKGLYVCSLIFKRFTASHIDLWLSAPEVSQSVIGSGKFVEQSGGAEHAFWLVESDCSVTGRYDFDEDSITLRAVVHGNEIELYGMASYTVIEHIIALAKKLNYVLAPDVGGKWVFSQLRLKCPLPDKVQKFDIVRQHAVANRFSVNSVVLDDVEVGEIRFVVGQP